MSGLPEIRVLARAQENPTRIPPNLADGDLMGICCPAGDMSLEEMQPAIKEIGSWGFRVKLGDTIGKKDFTFGGTDEERRSDFQQMLNDPELKAILCARGGYGSIRILDGLQWEAFVQSPKWVIGFSDITYLHGHINRNLRIATLHSKMCNSFPADWSQVTPSQADSIRAIRTSLRGELFSIPVSVNEKNIAGLAEGELVGGNLKTMEALSGSRSAFDTRNKLLFVEDSGEYLYSLDRCLWNLKRAGQLDQINGLVVGGFRIRPDDPGDEFGMSLEEIVLEKVRGLGIPVCFDFPVGHQPENYPLKCGVSYQLRVQPDQVRLAESAGVGSRPG
jgi:muramoyltetrapeptide carboxypeptidase